MSNKTGQTASFMVRFNQHIFENEQGESDVQWRGQISHVQSGNKSNFAEVDSALAFMQEKLAELTISSMVDKTPEEQAGMLTKSFDIWKKMTSDYSKKVKDVIKDPKGQLSQIQGQIQNQLYQVGGELTQKIENSPWVTATKSDFKSIQSKLDSMSKEIEKLNKKVTKLSKTKK